MIKRKSIVISLLIFCVALHIHSDNIKNSICIVNHEDSQLDSLYSVMGKCLYNNGYMSTGRMMMGIDKYFGSGFIYRSKSDRCYVVTCQHVIGNTKYAKLKFEGDIPVEYEKCKVLTASRSLDLCLIECPKEAEQYALESYSNEVHDGMVVYSAGFPSLAGKPLWQYGVGIISNKNVNMGELEDNDSIMVVQHTAQVDAGNSGGPLMVFIQPDSIYRVLGVNMRKAFYREDTNYSIRCCHIDSIVNQYESGLRTGKSLEESIEGFKDAVKRGSADMAYYISSMWALSLDCKELTLLLKNPSQSINNEIRRGYPLYGISCLIAETIRSNIFNVNDFSVLIEDENDDHATTIFTGEKKQWRLHWVKELDEWKVISDECIDSKDGTTSIEAKISKKKFGLYNPDWKNMIGLSSYIPMTLTQGPAFMLKYSRTFLTYGMADIEMGVVSYRSKMDLSQGLGQKYGLGINVSIGADVPLHIHRVALDPYALVGAGYDLWGSGNNSKVFLNTFLMIKPGLKLGYEFLSGNMLFIGFEYSYKVLLKSDVVYSEYGYPLNNISVMIGFAW